MLSAEETLKNKISQTHSERKRDRRCIEYAELNKLVKKGTMADKRRFMEELAETAEKAASRNEMRTVHRITKQLVEKNAVETFLLRISKGVF